MQKKFVFVNKTFFFLGGGIGIANAGNVVNDVGH